MKTEIRRRLPVWGLLLILFLAGTAVRFVLADHPRVLSIYGDELWYYMLADSLGTGRGLLLYNCPSTYQKLLYTLCLVPAFWVKDRLLTLRLIALINAVIMNAGVFPVYWLGRRVTGKRRSALLCAGLYLLSADLMVSVTFMAECLYIPLSLALLCLFYRDIAATDPPPDRFCFCLLLGLCTWLDYFCKEVALSFVVAYGLFVLRDLLRAGTAAARKTAFVRGAGFLIGFAVPEIVLKLTLFRGLGNSYGLPDLAALLQPQNLGPLLYSVFYYLLVTVIGFCIFPFLLPAAAWKHLRTEQRRFYLFCLTAMLTIIAVAVCMYALPLDAEKNFPCTHVRYYSFFLVPFWMFVFPALSAIRQADRRRILAVGALFAAAMPFFRGLIDSCGTDFPCLQFMVFAMDTKFERYIPALCAFAVLAAVVILLLRPKLFSGLLITVLALITVFNNMLMVRLTNNSFAVDAPAAEQAMALRTFMSAHPDDTFLTAVVSTAHREYHLLDTFDYLPNHIEVPLAALEALEENDRIDLNGQTLTTPFGGEGYADPCADYLLLGDTLQVRGGLAEPVQHLDAMHLTLYRLQDDKLLPALELTE